MKTLKYITEDPIVWASEQDNEWGMPGVHTPAGSMNTVNLILGQLPEALCCMKKPS